ncbi:MAG: hypothetical protein ABEI99_10510 [Halobaculum sp.]
MSDHGDARLAARRAIEFETIDLKLADTVNSALDAEAYCTKRYNQTFVGVGELRSSLNAVEWELYECVSLLHMLGEMRRRTATEFGLSPGEPMRHVFPELVGIRHAIHHNGLVGLNLTTTLPDPHVVVLTKSVRRHGNWDDDTPDFETFFHDADDAMVVSALLEEARDRAPEVVSDTVERLQRLFGVAELREHARSVDLYSDPS